MAMFLLDAEMLAELTKHLNDLSCSLLGEQIDLQVEMITTIRNDRLISTNAVNSTASSEVIADSSGYGKGSNAGSCEINPTFTTTQPANARSCATTNEIVPTNPPIVSTMASLRERG